FSLPVLLFEIVHLVWSTRIGSVPDPGSAPGQAPGAGQLTLQISTNPTNKFLRSLSSPPLWLVLQAALIQRPNNVERTSGVALQVGARGCQRLDGRRDNRIVGPCNRTVDGPAE